MKRNKEETEFIDPNLAHIYLCPKCPSLVPHPDHLRETLCNHFTCAAHAPTADSPSCPTCGTSDTVSTHPASAHHHDLLQRASVLCDNSEDGCTWRGTWGDLREHVERDCAWRMEKCPHCGCNRIASLIVQHVTQQCPKVSVHCPHACGAQMPRGALKAHVESECPLVELTCPFDGCNEVFKRRDAQEHHKRASERHMALHNSAMHALMKQIQGLGKQIDGLEREKGKFLEHATAVLKRMYRNSENPYGVGNKALAEAVKKLADEGHHGQQQQQQYGDDGAQERDPYAELWLGGGVQEKEKRVVGDSGEGASSERVSSMMFGSQGPSISFQLVSGDTSDDEDGDQEQQKTSSSSDPSSPPSSSRSSSPSSPPGSPPFGIHGLPLSMHHGPSRGSRFILHPRRSRRPPSIFRGSSHGPRPVSPDTLLQKYQLAMSGSDDDDDDDKMKE